MMELLHKMARITRILGLRLYNSWFSTVCGRNQEFDMGIWQTILWLTIELHELDEVQTIDATGVDRFSASQHYANGRIHSGR